MPTVVLNVYSPAFPSITNRIRAAVYLQSSPQALVVTQIDAISGHPERTWSFAGLPRNNYGFIADEIDGSGNVVRNLAKFDVVPGEVEGSLVRGDEQIQVDNTPGFLSGLSVITFDGEDGKPDYRNWEITPSELTGRGILARGLDYSWDKLLGIFTLLQPGDLLQTQSYWNIHFDPISNPQGNSVLSVSDFSIRVIEESETLTSDDFGTKIIIEPIDDYIEITLPDIETVVEGRRLFVEVNHSSMRCVRFLPYSSDTINFLKGKIFVLPNESFSLYKFSRSIGVYEWRVCEAYGNFKNVGQLVSDDLNQIDLYNKQLLDGTIGDIGLFSRFYNEFVLNLPIGQICNFDDWSTGNNKYLYSLSNSVNPTFLNKFRFADRRNIIEKNNGVGFAGEYIGDSIGEHYHFIVNNNSDTGGAILPTSLNYICRQGEKGGIGDFKYTLFGSSDEATLGKSSKNFGYSSETKPKTISVNRYVLL